MRYATPDDLITRYGPEELLQLTDHAGIGVIDTGTVQRHLADATATIEGYLARRYALPVVPAPLLLTGLACDIARYTLHGKSATDSVRQAYADALKRLTDLSNGIAVLVGAAPAPVSATPASPPGEVRVAAPTRVFGPGSLAGFRPWTDT